MKPYKKLIRNISILALGLVFSTAAAAESQSATGTLNTTINPSAVMHFTPHTIPPWWGGYGWGSKGWGSHEWMNPNSGYFGGRGHDGWSDGWHGQWNDRWVSHQDAVNHPWRVPGHAHNHIS